MPTLILVRHSVPAIDPGCPVREWPLSEEGRLRCLPLADRLAVHRPDVFVASTEPKATETGKIVAGRLGKPCEVVEGLHEHDRTGVGWMGREEFEEVVAAFFSQPNRLLFGRETADEAHERFIRAVESAVNRYPEQNVAIVAHGTVITLLMSRATGLEPLPFWRRLGMPSFVVLSSPGLELVEVVECVG